MQVWHEEPEPVLYTHAATKRHFWRGFQVGAALIGGVALVVIFANSCRAEDLTGRVQVIDGDTVWHYAAGVRQPEKIRLLDIDAPESFRATCEAELIAGLRAKARLAELLMAKPVHIERCDEHGDRCEDRFGRTLARLHTPAGEVGAILMREGLAVKYEPGRKSERTAKWCGNG